jgi:type IV secretion system protein VirB3
MSDREDALVADPLFVGATRPPMRWGVTYLALLAEVVLTMEAFLVSKNLLTLLLGIPLHGLAMLFCARDARFFDLAALWLRTRLPALARNFTHWKGVSYSPLPLDPPNVHGARRRVPFIRL